MPFEFPMNGERLFLTDEVRKDAPGNFISTPDGTVHYQIGGPEGAPVVVLVHGFSVPYFIWDPTYEFLINAGFRTLRFDLFGRGYSDRPFERYDLDFFTRQLAQLLDALGIETCRAVMGLSMGGVISANFAVQHSERVEKLVLVDPGGFPEEMPAVYHVVMLPGLGELFFGALSPSGFEKLVGGSMFDPAEVELVIERYRAQIAIKGFRRALLSTLREKVVVTGVPIYRQLGQLKDVAVQLFWGTEDRTIPFHFSKALLSLVPQTRFHPVEGAGHVPHIQYPEIVNPALLDFLNDEK